MGAINNEAFRSINQIDTLAASTSLRHLRKLGLLEAKNRGPSTYYIPTEKLLAPLLNFSQLSDKTHQLSDKTHQLSDKTHQLSDKTHQFTQQINREDLPTEIREYINHLNKKSPAAEVRKVILAICEWQTMTTEQLSLLLNRDKKHLVRKYLSCYKGRIIKIFISTNACSSSSSI